MSEKKHPTRMHEILGVEPNERFKVQNWYEKNEVYVDDKGDVILVINNNIRQPLDARDVCVLVNHPERIIRKPKLTEEQIRHLKGWALVGATHVAEDSDGDVRIFWFKPSRGEVHWGIAGQMIFLHDTMSSCLCDLVSWSDPEPLDIAATLKAAGVEV